jgi:TPP-dependent pyruvate/acetoin dehydrogenase alpha subunit
MSLELLTILDKDGKAPKDKDPNLPADELKRLYRLMVTTRAMDDRGLALQRQGRIGFYLQSTGQEASHLGAAYALKDSDWLFPAYRQPGIRQSAPPAARSATRAARTAAAAVRAAHPRAAPG